jgi:MFS family permease
MRGTGHYNLALGFVATAQGIGASLSGLEAGLIVDHFSYNAAFATSAAVALVALAVLGLALPETSETSRRQQVAAARRLFGRVTASSQ